MVTNVVETKRRFIQAFPGFFRLRVLFAFLFLSLKREKNERDREERKEGNQRETVLI